MKKSVLIEYLKNELKQKIDAYFDDMPYCETKFNPPKCKIITNTVNIWLQINAKTEYSGKRWDFTTDDSKGDYEGTKIIKNWVGIKQRLPNEIWDTEILNKWAIISTEYEIHNLRAWGEKITKFSEDGIITITIDSPSNEIETKSKYFDLNKIIVI